jgi:RNA polymerase sigma-70 factor (ECF subfamily)
MAELSADDRWLLREMRKGNDAAFGLLYERHQGALFRFVLHMSGSSATAEEITHDVFLHFIRKPSSYDADRGPLRAYLFGVARNLVCRSVHSTSLLVCFDDSTDLDAASPEELGIVDKLSNSESLALLRKALQALPEIYREVVVMCDLEEMSYSEAASIVNCSTGTVASRLHRAHKLLRAKLVRDRKGCARQT